MDIKFDVWTNFESRTSKMLWASCISAEVAARHAHKLIADGAPSVQVVSFEPPFAPRMLYNWVRS